MSRVVTIIYTDHSLSTVTSNVAVCITFPTVALHVLVPAACREADSGLNVDQCAYATNCNDHPRRPFTTPMHVLYNSKGPVEI